MAKKTPPVAPDPAPATEPAKPTFPKIERTPEQEARVHRNTWTERLRCERHDRERVVRVFNACLEDITKLRCTIVAAMVTLKAVADEHGKSCPCAMCGELRSLESTLNDTSRSKLGERAERGDVNRWFGSFNIPQWEDKQLGVGIEWSKRSESGDSAIFVDVT